MSERRPTTLSARHRRHTRRPSHGRAVPPDGSPSLTAVWEEWLEEAAVALRPLTVTAYRHAFAHRIVPLLGEHVVSEIGRRDVLALIRALQRDSLAAWTIRGTIVPLGLFLTWTIDQGWRTGNPVLELAATNDRAISRKQHRNLTADEIWQLIEAAAPDRRAFVGALGVRRAPHRRGARPQLGRRRLRPPAAARPRPARARHPPEGPAEDTRALRTIELDDGLCEVLRTWKDESRFTSPPTSWS